MNSPRAGNTGGKSPAFVDWCRFAVRGVSLPFVRACIEAVVGPVDLRSRGRGWQGYEASEAVVLDGVDVGIVAHGGAAQRGWITVDLSGVACSRVSTWLPLVEALESCESRLSRVDCAADFHAGERSVEECVALYRAGEFAGSGRPPSARLVDDLGNGTGRTLYVGERAGAKFLRVYEKGRQLGDASSPWVRVELEFKARDCDLPLAMLLAPEDWLEGAYPAFAGWFESQDCRALKYRPQAPTRVVEHALEIARQQVGGVVNVLAGRLGWTASRIVASLMRLQPSKRLVFTRATPPAPFVPTWRLAALDDYLTPPEAAYA